MDPTAFRIFENYFLAMLLGALMGLERERKESRLAGFRTFILVTLFGAICGEISSAGTGQWVVPAGIIAVTVQAAVMHFLRMKENLSAGLTTSVALLVAYGIGVLVAMDLRETAVALSLVTTAVLYFKPQMHEFSHRISDRDIYAIFQFGLIAFVILPILPDRGYGPYEALNPYNIWLMVVLISAINLAGYVTLKLVGNRWSGPVLGILGGVVSSTATTLSFSRHARDNAGFSLMGAVVVSLASTVVLARMAFLVGVIHIDLLTRLALPLVVMFLCGLVPVYLVWKKTSEHEAPVPETKNPMELTQALVFGLIYAVIILAVSAAQHYLGDRGVYIVSLISGLTDVDAITLSNTRLVDTGTLAPGPAAISLLIAYVSNLGFKLALVGVIGTRKMFGWSLLCFVFLAVPALLILV